MKTLVIIPTYNECENIEKITKEVLQTDRSVDVLVVDDNSPDGTAGIVHSIQSNEPRVHLLLRKNKQGLGKAYIAGFKYAIEHEYDYIFEMDADFSHDPKAIQKFLEKIQDCDLVLGSRYLHGVTVINWPLRRLFLSYSANLYSRIVTGMSVKDATSGFKCFRREVLEAIDLDRGQVGGIRIPDRDVVQGVEKGISHRRTADHIYRPGGGQF